MSRPKVFDVFSGAGGFSLGFHMAGCEIIGAIELDQWAADTFVYNHPSASMMIGDIETIPESQIRQTLKEEPDIIIGGPPCQGFSICRKNAGDPKDPRNSLFVEFIRMARIYMPKVMVMENVPNIENAKTKNGEKVIDIIRQEFENLGYHVYHRIVSASDFGVPQMRNRFILIASKKELDKPFPSPTHYVFDGLSENPADLSERESDGLLRCPTLWEAISDLPHIEACEGAEVMEYDKDAQNIYQLYCRAGSRLLHNHLAMKHTKRLVERFSNMTWGQSISDITDDRLKQRKRNGNGEVTDRPYDQNNRRMHPNRICHTITATFYGNFVHPYSNRNFTAREGARIQSFPDTYVFLGKPTTCSRSLLKREGRLDEMHLCQYSQIGNAVPPLLAKALAQNILNQVFNNEGEN